MINFVLDATYLSHQCSDNNLKTNVANHARNVLPIRHKIVSQESSFTSLATLYTNW